MRKNGKKLISFCKQVLDRQVNVTYNEAKQFACVYKVA